MTKQQLVQAITEVQVEEALQLAREMLAEGEDPYAIMDAGREAMSLVGARYEQGTYFLPELVICGELLKQIAELVRPKLQDATAGVPVLGKVVIGTVAGDIHDLGKDIVSFMLDVNQFQVFDLGADVPAAVFVEKIKEVQPEIVGLSGFLTLAFDQMKATVEAITAAGLRDKVKIMIGGAPMNDANLKYIGADAYGRDGAMAVQLAQSWMGKPSA